MNFSVVIRWGGGVDRTLPLGASFESIRYYHGEHNDQRVRHRLRVNCGSSFVAGRIFRVRVERLKF